jgi:hypothetical protein
MVAIQSLQVQEVVEVEATTHKELAELLLMLVMEEMVQMEVRLQQEDFLLAVVVVQKQVTLAQVAMGLFV